MKRQKLSARAIAALIAENEALKAKTTQLEGYFTMPVTFQTELHNLRNEVHGFVGDMAKLSIRIGKLEPKPKRRARK